MLYYHSIGILGWDNGASYLSTYMNTQTKNVLIIYDEQDAIKIPSKTTSVSQWLSFYPTIVEINSEEESYMKKVQEILKGEKDWIILCSESQRVIIDLGKIGLIIPQPSKTYFGVA